MNIEEVILLLAMISRSQFSSAAIIIPSTGVIQVGVAASLVNLKRCAEKWNGWISGCNNESEPTVTRFDAIVKMTNVSDGSAIHEHTFSNFRQSDIVFASGNSITINGTMTVTTKDGPTEDVPAYMTLQNNLIAIFVNPNAVDNHSDQLQSIV